MLTWLDIVLLVVLGLSAVVGLWRGFVGEVMSLAVWVAAFWLAFAFGPDVAAMFEPHVDAPTARWLLGYVSVFLLALVVGGLATWLIGKLVKSTGLSGTDRILGLGFGLVRGAAVWAVSLLRLSDWCSLLLQVPLGAAIYIFGSKLFHLDSFEYVLSAAKKLLGRRQAG